MRPPAGTYLIAFSSRLTSACASSCRLPLHDAESAPRYSSVIVALAGFGPIELDQLSCEGGQIDLLGRHFAAAAVGLRDLQQRAERSLHTLEFCERGFHRFARGVGHESGVLQRFFDANARAVERGTQVVRGAVECRAQHVGLLLDAIEHAVHRCGERVELIVRSLPPAAAATGRRP